MINTLAIILAAGSGLRFSETKPKQYCLLSDLTVLYHSVNAFLMHASVDKVCVAIKEEDLDLYEEAIAGLENHPKLLPYVIGGQRRQDSARLALESLKTSCLRNTKVLIHDAARPGVSEDTITKVLQCLDHNKAVDVYLPIFDTIKMKNSFQAFNRSDVYLAQTPQGFEFDTIYDIHQELRDKNFTDDISMCIEKDIEIGLVQGSDLNFKITKKEDLYRMNKLIEKDLKFLTRVGVGLDIHKISQEDSTIKICGLELQSKYKISAHSDGDVGLHAITEALLGSVAAGNIGMHFPNTDERWRNADSRVFVKKAAEIIKDMRGQIINIDVSIVCEHPKIMPHADKMRDIIANLLSISRNCISIKATTSENIGFIGREEGIAAYAVCSVIVPS